MAKHFRLTPDLFFGNFSYNNNNNFATAAAKLQTRKTNNN